MSHRSVALAGILGLSTVVSGCGAGDSPQGAIETARAALRAGDHAAFLECLSEKSRRDAARGMVLMASMAELLPALASVSEVSDRHGLTKEKMEAVGDGVRGEELLDRYLEQIDDVQAFTAEMLTAVASRAAEEDGMGNEPFAGVFEAELVELKVDGDRAEGALLKRSGTRWAKSGRESRTPVRFVRTENRWLVDIDSNLQPEVTVDPARIVTVEVSFEQSFGIDGHVLRHPDLRAARIPDPVPEDGVFRSAGHGESRTFRFGPVDDLEAFVADWPFADIVARNGRTLRTFESSKN